MTRFEFQLSCTVCGGPISACWGCPHKRKRTVAERIVSQATIRSIRQCECAEREGTAHVQIIVQDDSAETWTICLGPSQAEGAARSLAEAARAAGIKFDQQSGIGGRK